MNVVVTNVLTARRDPARGKRWTPNVRLFADLERSVCGLPLVVLHDCFPRLRSTSNVSYVQVPPGGNPYFARWRNIAAWLNEHPEAERVWCVDATDVVMLHDPFPHMQPGAVYSGSEPRPLGGTTDHHGWLYQHHPSRSTFYAEHPDLPFMNPGILGGSRHDVLAACEALGAEPDTEMTDMGAWQQICHDLFGDRIVTGHPVHTLYRAMDHANPEAWWAHK